MMTSMVCRLLSVLFGVASALSAETAVPPIWPQLQGIFPNGAQRGTEVKVTLRGRNLQDANEIVFHSPKVTGRVTKATAYQVEAAITVAADAEPGRHDLRLISPHGSTIGYFDVGVLPERNEREPNQTPEQAETIAFPTVINGIIGQGDYDYFKFQVNAEQTVVFDVLATRNGANTDAVLSIVDQNGEELAYNDDYYGFKDPHVVYTFEKQGTYFVRVFGSSEAGSNTSVYRLIAGSMPHVDYAMPAGGKAGSTVEVTLHGVNLEGLKDVILGDAAATGQVVSASATQAKVRLVVPKELSPGDYRLHAGKAPLPVPFVVSPYSEISVADGRARRRTDPVPVSLPVVVNGVLDKPRAADYFIFRVDNPKTVVLDANSMQLGFLTDPLVAIYDETGKRLAYQDDPTTNTGKEPANLDPHLVYKIEKPGRYVAMVRDAQFRGDPTFVYRVTLKEAEPDFSVKTIGTQDTFYRGRTNSLLVRVRRLEGWNAPVKVWADNLPPGVKAEVVTAETKNTPYTGTCGETHYLDGTNIELRFTVDRAAPLMHAPIVIKASGEFEGRRQTHTAQARYFRGRVRHIGDAEEDELRLTIADAPGAVLDVPQSLTLDTTGSVKVTAIVTRLDGTQEPLELSLETAGEGLTMKTESVPVTASRAEVSIRAADKATGEFRLIGRVGGVMVGKSHPVQVRLPKS